MRMKSKIYLAEIVISKSFLKHALKASEILSDTSSSYFEQNPWPAEKTSLSAESRKKAGETILKSRTIFLKPVLRLCNCVDMISKV